MDDLILVTGAGGFVGGHLVGYLRHRGFNVRAVSSRRLQHWIKKYDDVENLRVDLRDRLDCEIAVRGVKWIFNLAAKVGGIDYIGDHKAACFSSVLINTNLLRAARHEMIGGYLFVSSACVYGSSKAVIYETDPLQPSEGYGDEKAYSEKVCKAFSDEYRFPIHIVRPTGVYGPGDDIKGAENRDHVPAALCRKVIAAKVSGRHEISIWGDGTQTRDFLYVHDLVQGMALMMTSGLRGVTTVNMGGVAYSINDLVTILEDVAAIKLTRFYNLDAPTGVQHRSLSNDHLWETLRWQPPTSLEDGLRALYRDLWEKATIEQP